MTTSTTTLDIAKIQRRQRLQMRAKLDVDAIDRYATALQEGTALPPVLVASLDDDKGALVLVDGWHRVAAHEMISRTSVDATVQRMTTAQALRAALAANSTHGVPRTQADRRKAVTAALLDDAIKGESDREVARICGVSHPLVAAVRRDLAGEPPLPTARRETEQVERDPATAPVSVPRERDEAPAPSAPRAPAAPQSAPQAAPTLQVLDVVEVDEPITTEPVGPAQARRVVAEMRALAQALGRAGVARVAGDDAEVSEAGLRVVAALLGDHDTEDLLALSGSLSSALAWVHATVAQIED